MRAVKLQECQSAGDKVGFFCSKLPSPLQNVAFAAAKDWGLSPSPLPHLHICGEEKRLHPSAATFVPEKKVLEAIGIKCLIALLTSVPLVASTHAGAAGCSQPNLLYYF